MSDPCQNLVDMLTRKYKVENLEVFMNDPPPDVTTDVTVYDKETKNRLASIWAKIKPYSKEIRVALVSRERSRNYKDTSTKGLGKLLLFLVACRAMQLGFSVTFSANPSDGDALAKYYNKIGFIREKANGKNYLTIPTPETFHSRIVEAIADHDSANFQRGGSTRKRKSPKAKGRKKNRTRK